MTWFAIFSLLAIGAVGGYSIGHDCGQAEGYLKGRAEEYKAGQSR